MAFPLQVFGQSVGDQILKLHAPLSSLHLELTRERLGHPRRYEFHSRCLLLSHVEGYISESCQQIYLPAPFSSDCLRSAALTAATSNFTYLPARMQGILPNRIRASSHDLGNPVAFDSPSESTQGSSRSGLGAGGG